MSINNLYNLGQKLGLTKNDIDYSLKDETSCLNKIPLSFGPIDYNWGTLYGTINSKDFLK